MRKLLLPLPAVYALLSAPSDALAQGSPPPIELASDASQVVEMTLSLRDVGAQADLEMDTPNGERIVRTQSGGIAGRGELEIWPPGSSLCFTTYADPLGLNGCLAPLDTNEPEDPIGFWVYEFPSVEKGPLDPWFRSGEVFHDVNCTGGGSCGRYFDDAPESEAESRYQHRQGILDVEARVETPDIGIWDFREDRYHQITAIASASLGDWIYITASGPTATLVVNAALDEEIDDPGDPIVFSDDWITEGAGDLRELPVCGGTGPIAYADQSTRFFYRFAVTEWELVEECDFGEGGPPICNEDWQATQVASRSLEERRYSYLDYPPVDICNADPIIVQQDTAPMPNADEFQTTVPANRWLSIDALVVAESECAGSLACNLLARSGDPVAITLSSPDGTIVSWQGVAGTTRVPEPGAAAGLAVAIGALAAVARRGRRSAAR
jgi:hypothetical protein